MPAAHPVAVSSLQARRRSPARRQPVGHTMADAWTYGSRAAGQATICGANRGVVFASRIIDRAVGSVEVLWPWWPSEGVEADDRAGQHGQRVEAFRAALVADPQPPEAAQPGPGALDPPAVAAKPGRGLDHAAGDPRLDATPAQLGAAAAMVIRLVGVEFAGPSATPPGGHADRRDVVQHRLQHGGVVGVGRAYDHRQRQPIRLASHMELGAGLASVDGVCAGQVPPLTARRLNESTLTRPRSTRPASPSSSSSSSWRRSNTPARAHSANRRQQVVTLPQPNSPTGSSAQGVELRA
jgi:hypothetical protein